MNEQEFNQLLARWAEQTRLHESEAAATLPMPLLFPRHLPGVDEACLAPWIAFWECLAQMLCCVTQIGQEVAERCNGAAP